MELRDGGRRALLIRMDEHDRVSQASSVATISYFPVVKESNGKVQTFGKRCQAAKRDPNCPVVIRGWLHKKDSSGLKLWKRRWFVLSNYCLYYYKDSREETVLGSIPLPSYKILFCLPRECKNRKFTFKVVHQGMRSYFFSADTQEDMLGWVRALSQSAAMEPDSSLNRRCSSYQDFTQISDSRESVDFHKSPSEEESPTQKRRHVSRTLSEPGQLLGGRMGRSQSEQRGRRGMHYRHRSPSNRTPSPPDLGRRRACGRDKEEPHDEIALSGLGPYVSRGQLGSRSHTPVGRVDIRPHDDPVVLPQGLFYAPASPKLEFKSAPTTPVTERWQNMSRPAPIYGSVRHAPGDRRPLGKSYSTGADLLPPLPPSRAAPSAKHHHHHHCNHLSVCAHPPALTNKADLRELPIRPLESDADAVLTRLCGCDKLLQSLSVELTQLQLDKDSVQCALEVSRLQVEEWRSQGPRAHEEALTQKALLQEELVTIRARMCDLSLEMDHVWSQYERTESELSVIQSHLQHICNFGLPQEQCQAQRELWMMEDILAGLKFNRDYFCFLLGLQTNHVFQATVLPPGPPGSPAERPQSGLPMDVDLEPPVRPPLPLELQGSDPASDDRRDDSSYEGIHCPTGETLDYRGSSQPDLLNMKAQRDAAELQSGSKWTPPDITNQSTKRVKTKMSEEEQLERMKRSQERETIKKKLSVSSQTSQNQSSETRDEAPFPIRVTRVITAVLPTSLVARRVCVEDPPAELDNPLPEQIQSQNQEEHRPAPPAGKTDRWQHQERPKTSRLDTLSEMRQTEARKSTSDITASEGRSSMMDIQVGEQAAVPEPDLSLSPEQREAKLRRVERIRERVLRSAVRERATTDKQHQTGEQRQEIHQIPPEAAKMMQIQAANEKTSGSAEFQLSGATSHIRNKDRVKKSKGQVTFENKTQQSRRAAKTPSPTHISSMTVYQKDGGEGFLTCTNHEQDSLEEGPADGDDNKVKSSSHLRAKWFLSTNQWHGFMPLQIPGLELPSKDDNQASFSKDATDPDEVTSALMESLKKMKDNHSIFYKIACDTSISDSDVTKNDDQMSTKSEEELVIREYLPDGVEQVGEDSRAEVPSEETISKTVNSRCNLSIEVQEKDLKDQESEVNPEEECPTVPGPHSGMMHCSHANQEPSERKKSEERQENQSDESEERRGLKHGNNEKEEFDGGSLIPSASFGKPRMTVIRTSL